MSARTLSLEASLEATLRRKLAQVCPTVTIVDELRAYRDDPVGFCRDWLGFEPTRFQRQVLASVQVHKKVSVRSGRRVGKSYIFGALALWFYCCHGPDARVILLANTDDQLKAVMWRAVDMLARNAKRPIPGVLGDTHKSGLVWHELFCEIKGYTARKEGTAAGIAGKKLMFLIDEASDVADYIFSAVSGNMAGGDAWACLISNPRRVDGFFFETHTTRSSQSIGDDHGYHCIAVSSFESPNVTGECGAEPISGLATQAWIDSELAEWGPDSLYARVNIHGEFPLAEEDKPFSYAKLEAAKVRWAETQAEGRLFVGVDPAGHGGQGDESAFVHRRGKKVLGIERKRGLTAEAHVAKVLEILQANVSKVHDKNRPVVVVDAGGDVGASVRRALVDHLDKHADAFELVPINDGWAAGRWPLQFIMLRDEIAKSAVMWIDTGGAIPNDTKLTRDLNVQQFQAASRNRLTLRRKDGPNGIRAELGRSPDTGDAFMLCCWVPRRLQDDEDPKAEPVQAPSAAPDDIDAYRSADGIDPFGGRMDPYSGRLR